SYQTTADLRSSHQDRLLRAEDLSESAATLIVASDALVEHWAEQIGMHVVDQGLRIYVDKPEKLQEALPESKVLAAYDVVIVSFARMTKEFLLSVHWLRAVVDEGHNLGSGTTTQLMEMTRLLCAERRWVMAGTPS
ncbi:hypothetical protein F442_19839, partial [Phytophthora nicotianae P10297]